MKKLVSILCIFVMLLNVNAYGDIKPPPVAASGAALIDYNSGQFIIEKNSHGKFAPASTTKIMTALLTLENCKLSDKVVVGKNPPFEDGSKIYLIKDEELTVEQLLYALLLESANDAALALGEHISGSKEAFAALMNKRALELGCTDTHFNNPNGLYDKNHYTSAHDLALISLKAMENPIFRKIVATTSYNIAPTNKQKQIRHLHNHNKLLSVKSDEYAGADGVKTGYTVKSKHTYVGSATRNSRTLIAVFLHDDKTFYKETAAYLNYGFNNFIDKKIISNTDIVGSFLPKNSQAKVPVHTEKDVYVTINKNTNPQIKREISFNTDLSSFKKGDIVGTVKLTDGRSLNKTVNLLAGEDYVMQSNGISPAIKKSVNGIFRFSNIKYVLLLGVIAFLSRGFYRKYKRNKSIFKF